MLYSRFIMPLKSNHKSRALHIRSTYTPLHTCVLLSKKIKPPFSSKTRKQCTNCRSAQLNYIYRVGMSQGPKVAKSNKCLLRYIRVHIGIRIVFNYFYLSKEKSQDDKFSTVVLKKSCELKESLACIVYKQDETSLTACSLGNCLRLRDLFFFSSFGFVQPKAK